MLTEDVRRSAEARGPAGAACIESLPGIVAHLQEAWRAPQPPPTGWHRAVALAEYCEELWADLGQPCPRTLLDRVLEYARHRLASDAPTVLCHGDPHVGNALAVSVPRPGAASGYVFVDPDGFSWPRLSAC